MNAKDISNGHTWSFQYELPLDDIKAQWQMIDEALVLL